MKVSELALSRRLDLIGNTAVITGVLLTLITLVLNILSGSSPTLQGTKIFVGMLICLSISIGGIVAHMVSWHKSVNMRDWVQAQMGERITDSQFGALFAGRSILTDGGHHVSIGIIDQHFVVIGKPLDSHYSHPIPL